MPTCPAHPPAHHAHTHLPITPNTPRWGGCKYLPTHKHSNHPSHHTSHHHPHHHTPTHPMSPPTTHLPPTHPPHEPSNHPTTNHPMRPPKYMYSHRVTLWICLMGGLVGVHKMKYYDIITVHVLVSICTVIE